MGKINVLSFAVANLIAAGEVVDRPASVIKELMENAIDAAARHITVEIQNGGVTFMRVSDDGCGMEPDDLPVAIRRHATSKIREATDLDGIATLGFRGEALAAIASVSRLRILSKQRGAPMGALLEARAGEIVSLSETGCMDGTTVIVEALFANVPARRKFLKKDATEAQAVCAAVERVALSHPEISFQLIVDGVIKLHTAGDGKLQSTVHAVFGRDFATRLLELRGEYEGIGVSGYIGRPDNVKGTRNYQNFFINGRWVKSKTAVAALEQAFCSYLPPDKFPACVMNITLNPARVDVNVHPAKLEVKFSNEKLIFEAIYYTVRQALEQNESRPDLPLPTGTAPKSSSATVAGARRVSDAFVPVTDRPESVKRQQLSMEMPAKPAAKDGGFVRLTAEEYVRTYLQGSGKSVPQQAAPRPSASQQVAVPSTPQTLPADQAMAEPPQPETPVSTRTSVCVPQPSAATADAVDEAPVPSPQSSEQTAASTPWRLVGEVFHSYVIVEAGDKMLLIDQHAAHERILFEDLKARLHSLEPTSQMLMLPVEIMLMSDEVAILDEYRHELEAIGFVFTTARNTVSVSALPTGIEPSAAEDMLCAMADRIKNNTGSATLTRDIIFEKALYQGACKAAIKAGRQYADGHLAWLCEQLQKLPDITFCPHGRPVAMEMTKQYLDHRFERC